MNNVKIGKITFTEGDKVYWEDDFSEEGEKKYITLPLKLKDNTKGEYEYKEIDGDYVIKSDVVHAKSEGVSK